MTEEIFKGIEQVIDWEKYTQLFDEANQNRDTDYTLPMIKDIFKSDLQHLIDSVSADQNKELIEELETERKLGLKLNSDYTDLNTRLSAELSQQKELVEEKDKAIEKLSKNDTIWRDEHSKLTKEIEVLTKIRHDNIKLYNLHIDEIAKLNECISESGHFRVTVNKELDGLKEKNKQLDDELHLQAKKHIEREKISRDALATLKESLEEKDKEMREWRIKYNDMCCEYDKIQSTLESQAKEIADLKKENDKYISHQYKTYIAELKSTISEQSSRIKELEDGMKSIIEDEDLPSHHKFNLLKSLLSTPTTEEEKVLYTKSATVNSGDSINEEIYTCKKCKVEIGIEHEGYCPKCGNIE